MIRGSTGGSLTITLIADVRGSTHEEAQASWWRPLSWRWPAFSRPPALQILDWAEAADPATELAGSAVLAIPDVSREAALHAVLDRLADRVVPVLVLHGTAEAALPADEHALTLPRDADPAVIAATLAALAERQNAIETLRVEIGVTRRFHGGLRGEIEKIHEEMQLAASVQREFLPRELPRPASLDLNVLFRPCGYVSGDIYDVQQLDDDHIGFFVADAVGHGVPAALMTMVLCRCLSTVERGPGKANIVNPARAMKRLNQDLIQRHGEGSRFATGVYGIINTSTRHVTIAGAGHPYPLRIRGEDIVRVETEGGLLGLDIESEFDEASFTLAHDELLVVYSDGFETAFPAPSLDSYGRRLPNHNYVDRFIALATQWKERGLTAAALTLTEQIDQQTGSLHQADDLTALVIAPRRDDPLDDLMRGRAHDAAPHEPGSAQPIIL